ncbi:MAG: hypothetical protein AAGT88_02890 [Dethiobacter sp.]
MTPFDNFISGPEPEPKDLEDAFRCEVLKLLKDTGKINGLIRENMMGWYHLRLQRVLHKYDQSL